jgi:hypothetical protein
MHVPPNTIQSIDRIWAYLSRDEGGEGVLAAPLIQGIGPVPLIAADEARLESLTSWAEAIAAASGKEVVLVEFTCRRELRTIRGKTDG